MTRCRVRLVLQAGAVGVDVKFWQGDKFRVESYRLAGGQFVPGLGASERRAVRISALLYKTISQVDARWREFVEARA